VNPTVPSRARGLVRQRPRIARGLLWLLLTCLVAGELANTIWWVAEIGLQGLVILCSPLAFGGVLLLCSTSIAQAQSMVAPHARMVVAALPAYAAVQLLVPPPPASTPQPPSEGVQEAIGPNCWEVPHAPIVLAIFVVFASSALVPALFARDRTAVGGLLQLVHAVLEHAKCMARGFCILVAVLYVAVAWHIGVTRLRGQEQATFSWWGAALASSGRAAVLALHACSLACAEARRSLVTALGDDILPLLLGAQEEKSALTVTAFWPSNRIGTSQRTYAALFTAIRRCDVSTILSLVRQDDFFLPLLSLMLVGMVIKVVTS